MASHFVLHEYSHGFEIRNPSLYVQQHIDLFASKFKVVGFATEKQKKDGQAPVKRYIAVKSGEFYRFHISQLQVFISYIADRGFPAYMYEHIQYGMYEPTKVTMHPISTKTPRGQQPDAISFVTRHEDGFPAKLLEMPTGTGKTFVSLSCACILSVRTAVVVAGGYVEKWIADIQSNTDVTEDEIYVVQGGSSLLKLLHTPKEDIEHIKFIVFSIETLNVYYKAYEEANGNMEHTPYPFSPEQMYMHTGVGFVIYDEIHESLNLVYKSFTFTHVPAILGLSATFESMQESIIDMMRQLFPYYARFDDIKMNKYITVHPIFYSFENFAKLNVQTRNYGMNTYSHTAFENWIMKRPVILRNYMTMIGHVMYYLFQGKVDTYKPGDKALVFAATKEMVDKIYVFLREQYPNLKVNRYIYGDPYDEMLVSDITVTTPGGGGTAVDIPGLTFVWQTVAIQSPVANKQSLGRLREIPGREVKYAYATCSQIQHHKNYHRSRVEMFRDRTKAITELTMPFAL